MNSGSSGMDAAEIAGSSGVSLKRKAAHAQAMFAKFCGPNAEIRASADSDIECIRGSFRNSSLAQDHAVIARSGPSNSLICCSD
jgi:hypothetical protein